MAILKIVKFDEPMIRKVSRPVDEITPRIMRLLDDMTDTMRDAGGCGLAAVQVGVLRRVVVVEVEEGKVIELINPRIVSFSGNQEEVEGCLSNPGHYSITKRPYAVVVRALNRKGEEIEIRAEGLLARAICHECDHLDGKLYIDSQIRELSPDELEG